jgi:hypothetical protein
MGDIIDAAVIRVTCGGYLARLTPGPKSMCLEQKEN